MDDSDLSDCDGTISQSTSNSQDQTKLVDSINENKDISTIPPEDIYMNYENGRVSPQDVSCQKVISLAAENHNNGGNFCDGKLVASGGSVSNNHYKDLDENYKIKSDASEIKFSEMKFSNPCKRKRVPSIEYLDVLDGNQSASVDSYQKEKTPCTNSKNLLGQGECGTNINSDTDNLVHQQGGITNHTKEDTMGSGREISLCRRADIAHVLDDKASTKKRELYCKHQDSKLSLNEGRQRDNISNVLDHQEEGNSGPHQSPIFFEKGDNWAVQGCSSSQKRNDKRMIPVSYEKSNDSSYQHLINEGGDHSKNEQFLIHSETGEVIPRNEGDSLPSNLADEASNSSAAVGTSQSSCRTVSISFRRPIPEPSFPLDQISPTFEACEERTDAMFHINDFPSHLLIHIFKNLSMFHLLHHVSRVCKMWYQLSRDPDLWRVIDLRHQCKVKDEVLLTLCCYSDRVVYLDVSDAKLITEDSLVTTVMKCPHLSTLKLTRCFMVSDAVMKAVGQSCTNLQTLCLEECYKVTDMGLTCVAEGCRRLTELQLSSCRNIKTEGVEAVGRCCPHLKNIQLNSCVKLQNKAMLSLATGCPELCLINLQSSGITDEGVQYLHMLKKLRTIDISVIRSLTPQTVVTIVKGCRELETLNISLNASLDDSCLESIAHHCNKLKQLYCVACSITDNGLRILSQHCKSLTYLDIGWCQQVTCDGVLSLSHGCPALTHIGLIRCDNVSVEAMYELVEKFPHITYSTFVLESRKLIERARREGFHFQSTDDGTSENSSPV